MLTALNVLLCFFSFFIISISQADDYKVRYDILSRIIKKNDENIYSYKLKIKSKSIKAKEKKHLQKMKADLVFENFNKRIDQKIELGQFRHEYARKHEKIKLNYLPKGICKNPCNLNLEAIVNKKLKTKISKYIFYVDDRAIESTSSRISTTIFFSKNMLSDKQKKFLTKNVPLHKLFNLKVEGIISENQMLESKIGKIVVKSLPSNLTNIELITNKVLPYNKIQISTSGISSATLHGFINNIPVTFEIDPTLGSSQVLYTIMPNLSAGSYKLIISNFSLNIQVDQMPTVANPVEYVNNISNNAVSLGSAITEGDRFKNIISSDGITLFTKFNDIVIAFDNYIKNEATPSEIQEIANIINSSALGDSNTYFFVKNDGNSVREFLSIPKNNKFVMNLISILIETSYAQEKPQNLLKNLIMTKVTEAVKSALTISFNTIIDGMINKCYVSKGRNVPSSIVNTERYLMRAFSMSATAVLANEILGAYGYYATITAAQALVILIGNDCEGDSTIIPKLVIKSQPLFPIKPGESFNYDVKCDVGDSRYYTPGSILTKVTSRFDYISNELKETGDLIARDKLVHSCSGLGQDVIADAHNIFCTTNLLEETTYYQQNSKQYEELNISQCSGTNDSYDVGTYLVSNPDLSCNFVNIPNNVYKEGPKAFSKQLVFDLTKEMQCPPKPEALINYTKNNLVVSFNSTDPQNPSVDGLTYSWDFGDGQTSTTQSKTISHTYAQAGTYVVTLTVTDQYGASAEVEASVEVQNDLKAVINYMNYSLTVRFDSTDPENPDANLMYYWDFGDGKNQFGQAKIVTHNYSQPGNYVVTLIVRDSNGTSAQTKVTIQVINSCRMVDVNICIGISDLNDVTFSIPGVETFTFVKGGPWCHKVSLQLRNYYNTQISSSNELFQTIIYPVPAGYTSYYFNVIKNADGSYVLIQDLRGKMYEGCE